MWKIHCNLSPCLCAVTACLHLCQWCFSSFTAVYWKMIAPWLSIIFIIFIWSLALVCKLSTQGGQDGKSTTPSFWSECWFLCLLNDQFTLWMSKLFNVMSKSLNAWKKNHTTHTSFNRKKKKTEKMRNIAFALISFCLLVFWIFICSTVTSIASTSTNMLFFPLVCICNCWFDLSCKLVFSKNTSCKTETHIKRNCLVTQRTNNAHFGKSSNLLILMHRFCKIVEQITVFYLLNKVWAVKSHDHWMQIQWSWARISHTLIHKTFFHLFIV